MGSNQLAAKALPGLLSGVGSGVGAEVAAWLDDDLGDVLLVFIQRHAFRTMPDIVDATIQLHPIRLLGDDIIVHSGEHVERGVPGPPAGMTSILRPVISKALKI